MSTATPADDATRALLNPLPRVVRGGPRGLPQPLTPLIGRERDVAHAARQLRTGEVRLLTLTGPGGVGKTRLAIAIAGELADDYAAGAAFVTLAPVDNPDLVAVAVARALGVREAGDRSPAELLKEELRGQELLLALDNFEQVVGAAPLVTELLLASPRLVVLVTSRARLQVSGEWVMAVPPLALPAAGIVPAVEQLPDYPAVRLFIDRAQAAGGEVALTEENAAAVVEICHRLDGLPLAIELAAARSNVLAPPALLGRLTSRLPLLTGGPQDAPARLRTMRDAIAWSYDLLDLEEQALFRRLAVFVGGCKLDAAERVGSRETGVGRTIAGVTPDSVLDLIASLVDKSLVRQEERAGEPRFGMLETIREYALEQLVVSGEVAAVRERHARWCLDLAERTAAALARRRRERQWLDPLEVEHDNLRAALLWADGAGDAETALRLAGSLAPFWLLRSHRTEGRGWLERALVRPDVAAAPVAVRITALEEAAVLAYTQGDYRRASAFARDELRLCRHSGDSRMVASALNLLGAIVRAQGYAGRAAGRLEEALTLFRQLGDRWGIALALCNLGAAACGQGDLDRAEAAFDEALALHRELDDPYWIAVTLGGLGVVAGDRGDHRRAAALFAESLACWSEVETKEGFADALARIATLTVATGRTEAAARLFGAVDALRTAIDYTFEQPEQTRYRRAEAAARAALGESAFAAAWQAGRALPLVQAIAEATALAGDLAAPADSSLPRVSTAERHRLTPRELEVLRLLVEGTSDREIGEALGISHRTVETHVTSLLNKLGVSTRTAAAAAAVRQGLA